MKRPSVYKKVLKKAIQNEGMQTSILEEAVKQKIEETGEFNPSRNEVKLFYKPLFKEIGKNKIKRIAEMFSTDFKRDDSDDLNNLVSELLEGLKEQPEKYSKINKALKKIDLFRASIIYKATFNEDDAFWSVFRDYTQDIGNGCILQQQLDEVPLNLEEGIYESIEEVKKDMIKVIT